MNLTLFSPINVEMKTRSTQNKGKAFDYTLYGWILTFNNSWLLALGTEVHNFLSRKNVLVGSNLLNKTALSFRIEENLKLNNTGTSNLQENLTHLHREHMSLQMLLQWRKQRKWTATYITCISVLTRVQAFVPSKAGAVGEGTSAYRTAERFLTRVNSSMGK